MKSKIIVLSVFIFILTSVFAQKNQNKRTFDDFKAQKIALISERTQLTPEEAQHFWPVYNELQQKKSELHKKNRQQNKDLSGLSEADFEKMNEAASLLFNYEDFTSFSKLHTDAKTNICKIMKAQWQKQEDIYVFTIQANRFLRNMVRAIVGTLMEVGRGKISTKDFTDIIENKNRSLAGVSMPAQGLFLVDIEYPKDIF